MTGPDGDQLFELASLRPSVRRSVAGRWQHRHRWQPRAIAERARERGNRAAEVELLANARAGRPLCWDDSEGTTPLVTVRIASYGRPDLLVDRTLPSVLGQTYTNIEALVVIDGPDAATESALGSIRDPRLRVVTLPQHTAYPKRDRDRWQVAGYAPMNVAIELAQGAWQTPCDDDDELTPDHVEVLLNHARAARLELVYSKTLVSVGAGAWVVVGEARLREGRVTHGSVLYSSGLRGFRYSGTSYRTAEPFDWNMWRRMRAAGVRMGFLDAATYRYYPSAVTAEKYRALARGMRGRPAVRG